jgi:hypothetical protein
MEHVWIDTALLAIPNYAIEENFAHELFNRVAEFEAFLAGRSPIRLILSDHAEDDLGHIHCGPELTQIDDFLSLMGLDHVFRSLDILKTYQTMLSRAHRASDVEGLEVRSTSVFESSPELPADVGPIALRGLTTLAFASVAALTTLEDHWSVGSALASYGIQVFSIRTVFSDVYGEKTNHLGELPISIASNVRSITSFKYLICEQEAYRIWGNANCAADIYLGIFLMAAALRRSAGYGALSHELIPFVIGPEFINSLREHQCFGGERFGQVTLKKCGQIVANMENITVGKMGRPHQYKRAWDSAAANRVHLTSGALGLRLMFWRNQKEIEFSNVGVKKELIIEHGKDGAGFALSLTNLFLDG